MRGFCNEIESGFDFVRLFVQFPGPALWQYGSSLEPWMPESFGLGSTSDPGGSIGTGEGGVGRRSQLDHSKQLRARAAGVIAWEKP